MAIFLNNNGIVIQAKIDIRCFFAPSEFLHSSEFERYRSYNGIARYTSWPLESESDLISKALTIESHQRWFDWWYDENKQMFALNVVPDLEYCARYLKICKEKDIKTRILFCKTERETPIWNETFPKMDFLGYDYATSQDFYSTIPDDILLDNMNPLIEECREVLNTQRLFNTELDVMSYIEKRDVVIKSGTQIEDFGDFCISHLSEINPEFFRR